MPLWPQSACQCILQRRERTNGWPYLSSCFTDSELWWTLVWQDGLFSGKEIWSLSNGAGHICSLQVTFIRVHCFTTSLPEVTTLCRDFGVTRFAMVFVLHSCPHREPKVERMKMKCWVEQVGASAVGALAGWMGGGVKEGGQLMCQHVINWLMDWP